MEHLLGEILLTGVVLALTLVGWVSMRLHKKVDDLDKDVRGMPFKYVLKYDFDRFVEKVEKKLDLIIERLAFFNNNNNNNERFSDKTNGYEDR